MTKLFDILWKFQNALSNFQVYIEPS